MKYQLLILLCAFACSLSPAVRADSESTWEDVSDVGAYSLLATALVLPASREDWEGLRQAAYGIGTAAAVTQLGKAVFDEERPDDSGNDSFPSGHTSLAFSSATTLYRRYGWQVGFPAYAVATLTGVARERARKHNWYDVVAGAALGTASSWYFTSAFDSEVQVTPWVEPEGGGVVLLMRW